MLWLFLILFLLGLFTYFMLQRNVAKLTRTPIWLIWLVMMTPAFVWTAWWLIYGGDKPLPIILLIGLPLLCLFVYGWLIERGRIPLEQKPTSLESPALGNLDTPNLREESPKVRPITPTEEKTLRDCFPWGIYYLQQIDYRPQAILCRGKLRAVPELAYTTVKDNVEQAFGDRFLVLFQESLQGQPFFALVSNPWGKTQSQTDKEPLLRPGLALSLLLITLLTTTLIGVEISGVPLKELGTDWNPILKGLPYSLGLITILGIHELSHYLTAVYYKVRTTLPYFIPVPFFLGTFGAFIQMRSPVPNRKALFDVAIAGPIGGFLITLPLLIWGLSLSEVVPLAKQSYLFNFQALDPRFSFLFAVLGKLVLGSELVAGKAIHLHPLAFAGYLGLVITALNLMPVGQLDGGHIVHAMFGQKTGMFIGQITRLLMLVYGIIRQDFILWAIFLLLMPIVDQPALNDVTELDNRRDFLGMLSLVVLIIILLPLPGAVAQWLNI